MNKSKRILLATIPFFLLLQSCAPENAPEERDFDKGESSAGVIYGTDGRLDLYQVSDDRLKLLADSTVALIKNEKISVSGSNLSIKGENYGTSMSLCSSEKFREQTTAAFCSGALVSDDTIITAGHCITSAAACAQTSFVFGYAIKSQGAHPASISASEVYKCSAIVKQVLLNGGADFAVIKLDRKVLNHKPLAFRLSGEAQIGDSLVVIGHPVGLPTKITTGGKVRSIAHADYIVASVDTYGGNSGSAVVNSQTGLIEGILVRGEQDFEVINGCRVSKLCAEDSCRGEDITRISVVRPFIPVGPLPPPPPPPPPTGDKFSVTANLAIPDNNSVGIRSSMNVNKIPAGRKVFISVNISHTYIGDLIVKVTSPSGKVALLSSRAGRSTDNIIKTFDVTSILGTESKIGIYQITVQDVAARDVGFLNNWSLEFK